MKGRSAVSILKYLVGVAIRPSVNAVVRSVQVAIGEPSYIAVLETTRLHSSKGNIPIESLEGHLGEELARRSVNHVETYLRPPLVSVRTDAFGMCLSVCLYVWTNERDLGTILET